MRIGLLEGYVQASIAGRLLKLGRPDWGGFFSDALVSV
jgi:hypothetical protein